MIILEERIFGICNERYPKEFSWNIIRLFLWL